MESSHEDVLSRASSTSSDSSSPEPNTNTVEALARHITTTSLNNDPTSTSVLNPPKDSKLDPFSANFDPIAWCKAFVQLFETDPDAAPRRMTGVAFRDLSVYGFSSGSQYQRSAGNLPVSIASGLAARLTGREYGRVSILKDFEGVLHPREMLLVLGPPGSGCSTLLKTLSGQTQGLVVGEDSYLNFRGKPQHSPHQDQH